MRSIDDDGEDVVELNENSDVLARTEIFKMDNKRNLHDLNYQSSYCTLRKEQQRPKQFDEEKNLHFCTLRNWSSGSSYNKLDESCSTAASGSLYDLPTYENIDDDEDELFKDATTSLIDLNEGATKPDVEAINTLLLEKLENKTLIDEGGASEAKYRKPKSMSSTLDKDEQKQTIKELKRLTSYCTLRPEQKRKYLLRTIASLQTTDQGKRISDEANQALMLLHEINNFDKNINDFVQNNNDDGNDVTAEAKALSNYFNDPEKIEDCLLELDAYLEEIDRNCLYYNNNNGTVEENFMLENVDNNVQPVKTAAITSSAATNTTHISNSNNNMFENNNAEDIINLSTPSSSTTKRTNTTSINENNYCGYDDFLRRFSDYDNSNNIIATNNNRSAAMHQLNDISPSDSINTNLQKECSDNFLVRNNDTITKINQPSQQQQLQSQANALLSVVPITTASGGSTTGTVPRAQSYRTTLSGNNCSTTVANDNTLPRIQQKDQLDRSRRHPSWRRNSMRKTRPITMPEQLNANATLPSRAKLTKNRISHQAKNDINEFVSFATNQQNDRLPLVESMEIDENLQSQQLVPLNYRNNLITEPVNRNSIPNTEPIENCDFSDETNDFLNGITIHDEPLSTRTLGEEFLNNLTHMTDTNSNQSFNTTNSSNVSHYYQDNDNVQCVNRPRQMGRRAEGRVRVVSITTETNSLGNQRIIVNHDRPNSAPARVVSPSPLTHLNAMQHQQYNNVSETSSIISSRNASPVSVISSSASSSTASANENIDRPTTQPRQTTAVTTTASASSSSDPEQSLDDQDENVKTKVWPHGFSRILAATCCTLGLFNISRFSIFSIYFGANFIVQFIILSFIFGIPMIWLQMCLGARLKGGPISMWRVSPICKGVGISLVLIQAIVALYSAVSIAWVLVYFRDSFVSVNSRYRWQEPFELFRGHRVGNESIKLSETVADYFHGVVLQRYQLGPGGRSGFVNGIGAVRFQLAFNLAVVWITVFVVLCKGLRSYGKIVLGLMVLPLLGLAALCTKMLTMINSSSLQNIFPSTDWQDFFINNQSWLSAAQEVFLTWTMFGASVISIFSKATHISEPKTALRRDAVIVVFITLLGLILAAILGNACVQVLNDCGYYYFPGSYENTNSYIFLLPSDSGIPPQLAATPAKWLPRYSTVLGESYRRNGMNGNRESGYQSIRLVTELFPATLAAATQHNISAVWSLLGFLLFLIFGLGQLCAMWKPIAGALGDSTSSVLLSCVTGLLLAIPLATECGVYIIHFFDVILGGSWCVLLLWIGQIFAIFLVRGRPYSGDILVNDLRLTQTLSAFVALSWNIILPIGLMTLCILEYRQSGARDLYHWRGKSYWPMWVRKVGGFIQVGFLLLVPITSIIQIYRYLSSGPPDILDRIQLLYRPTLTAQSSLSHQHRYTTDLRNDRPTSPHRSTNNDNPHNPNSTTVPTTIALDARTLNEDAPPKYTPPPSYTTATGARLAKMFRNSIRRSVRRILGEPSTNRHRRPCLQQNTATDDTSLPPAYSTILVDPGSTSTNNDSSNITPPIQIQEIGPRALYNSQTINRNHHKNPVSQLEMRQRYQTLPSPSSLLSPAPTSPPSTSQLPQNEQITNNRAAQTLTARDVAQLLRPSQIHFHQRASSSLGTAAAACVDQVIRTSMQRSLSRSAENLILNVAPLGQSNNVIDLSMQNDDYSLSNSSIITATCIDNDNNDDSNTSVI